MNKNKYFKARNKKPYTKYTKKEIYHMVDNTNPLTFEPLLKELDYPYFPEEWNRLLKQYSKNGQDEHSVHIFGPYIATMRMFRFCDFTYETGKEYEENLKKQLQEHSCSIVQKYDFYTNEKVIVCYVKPYELTGDELIDLFHNIEKIFPKYNCLVLWSDLMELRIDLKDEVVKKNLDIVIPQLEDNLQALYKLRKSLLNEEKDSQE